MTATDTEIKKTARLKEIMQIMSQHHFVSNFYHQTNPEEVCQALQELGPTFIKLGQILSTRSDLVSPAYTKALRKLQDKVKVDDFASVQATFTAQTGKQLAEVFASFDHEPFASASIGQVHHATLKNRTPVVVKIQHPAVGKLVNTDLALLRKAVVLFKYVPQERAVVDLNKVIDELSASLLGEVNTLEEAHNGEEFYQLNNGDGVIRVPKVYLDYCAPKILVNEAMEGKSIRYLFDKSGDEQVEDRKHAIALTLVNNFLKQVFEDHYFHADPHPGNILIHEVQAGDAAENEMMTTKHLDKQFGKVALDYQQQTELPPYRIIYLDFGMMGRLTPTMADSIASVVIALNTKDIRKIGRALLTICNQNGPVDETKFFNELGTFIKPYFSTGLGEINFPVMLYQIIQLCQQNHLQMKPEVTMLIKAFGTLEGSIAKLDPSLSMLEVAQTFGRSYFKRKFNWRSTLDQGILNAFFAGQAITKFPEKLNDLIDTVVSGNTKVDIQYKEQNVVLKQLERLVNRLVAVVLAAVILGSSLLVEGSADHPHIYRLGVAGYIIAIAIIILLVLSEIIHRWKKRK